MYTIYNIKTSYTNISIYNDQVTKPSVKNTSEYKYKIIQYYNVTTFELKGFTLFIRVATIARW